MKEMYCRVRVRKPKPGRKTGLLTVHSLVENIFIVSTNLKLATGKRLLNNRASGVAYK